MNFFAELKRRNVYKVAVAYAVVACRATAGRGVDVALELIGSAKTMRQAVLCLALSDALRLSD